MKNFRYKKLLYPLLVAVLFFFLLFNEYGIMKYVKLRSEVERLNEEIVATEKELKQLNSEIDSVKYNLFKIEKLARERYHMLDSNEQALKIEKRERN